MANFDSKKDCIDVLTYGWTDVFCQMSEISGFAPSA